MNLKWINYCDTATAETPIGKILIEWSSLNANTQFYVSLNGNRIFVESSLELAKQRVVEHLQKVLDELLNLV